MSALLVSIILLSSALFHVLPNLTRPGLYFGVTVDPAFRRTKEGRSILTTYRQFLWTPSVGVMALLLLTDGFSLFFVILWLGGFVCALSGAHRQTLPYALAPSPARDEDVARPLEALPGGWVSALAPTMSLIVLGIWVSAHWVNLPQQLPVHWGVRGPDRWVAVTLRSVYGLLAANAVLCLVMAGNAWGVLRWSRRISASVGERRFRRIIALMLLVVSCFLAAQAWITVLRPTVTAMEILGAALTLVTISFLALLIREGQGGRDAAPTDGTPDACWKWGLVYFNPSDPALFVEKRFGIGYTLNFGNRWSWALSALLLIPIMLTRMLLR